MHDREALNQEIRDKEIEIARLEALIREARGYIEGLRRLLRAEPKSSRIERTDKAAAQR